jgi:signal transduction histidine kinase
MTTEGQGTVDERLAREAEERRRAEAAVRFLADAGATLAESLDYEATVARAVRLVVPFLADWCTLDLLDERGMMRRVAAVHRDPSIERILHEVRERQKSWGSPETTAQVLAGGKPLVFPQVTDEILARYVQDPEVRALVKKLGIQSGMAVPLIAHGRTIGGMTLTSNTPGRVYGPADLLVAEELCRRAAVAIDNARLYREAQEAVRLRDEFLAVASHELKAPLAPIQVMVEQLEHELRVGRPEATTATVQVMRRQIHRLVRLVEQLLDVAEMSAGHLTLHPTLVDLVAVVRDVEELLADDLARAQCPLRLTAPAQLDGRWDRPRIEQVIASLIGNALKFGPRHPIEVTVEEAGELARLIVRDHGMGISPDRLPNVFDRFERGVSARSYGGLGLGLFVVKQVVEAHGGWVRVESTPGVGSVFTVELPK